MFSLANYRLIRNTSKSRLGSVMQNPPSLWLFPLRIYNLESEQLFTHFMLHKIRLMTRVLESKRCLAIKYITVNVKIWKTGTAIPHWNSSTPKTRGKLVTRSACKGKLKPERWKKWTLLICWTVNSRLRSSSPSQACRWIMGDYVIWSLAFVHIWKPS